MRDWPYDSLERATTIDKAKESGRYDQATKASIEKIKSLKDVDVAELSVHPLADIYIQELVRCETVHLMKQDSFYDAHQLSTHLRTLLREELGVRIAKGLDQLIQRWVREFKSELNQATVVTQRKSRLDRERVGPQHRSYLATPPELSTLQSSPIRYRLEIHARYEGEFALEGTPLYGRFDAPRISDVFGSEFSVGFPVEINSEDYVFLLDYNGDFLSYGHGEAMESLLRAAEVLTRRLEYCFAPE